MKKILIIPIFLLVILNCSKSDNNETNIPPDLIGKWQFKSILGIEIVNIYNGGIIEFKQDNTFSSTILGYYPDYLGGTYTISPSKEITLIYNQSITYPDQLRTTQIVSLNSDELVLNPTDRTCDEGCEEVYSKNIVENQSGKK